MIRISIYSAFSGFFKQTKVTRPPAKWPKHKKPRNTKWVQQQ